MESEVTKLQARIEELEQRLAGDDRKALTKRALMAERKVAELQQEIKRAGDPTGNLAKLKSQFEELKQRLAARNSELVRMRAQASESSAGGGVELDELKNELDKLKKERDKLRKERDKLRNELTATQFSQSDYDEKLAEVDGVQDRLERDLQTAREERDEALESLRGYRAAERPAVAAELVAQDVPGPDGSFPGASPVEQAVDPHSGGEGYTIGKTHIGEPPMPMDDLPGSPQDAESDTEEGGAGSETSSPRRIWNILGFRVAALFLGLLIGIVLLYFLSSWFGAESPAGAGSQAGSPTAAAMDGGAIPADGGEEPVPADTIVDAGDGPAPIDAAARADQDVGRPARSPAEQKALKKAQAHGARLLKREEYRKAQKHMVRWVGKVPDDAGLRYLYGRALSGLRWTKAAVVQMEKAIELDPGYADAYYELGVMYAKLKRRAEAREALKKFIELAPGDRRVRSVRARLAKMR